MSQPIKDEERENRIMMDIIVDAFRPEEQAMGWYYYLNDTIRFPFKAECFLERPLSPLKAGEVILVKSLCNEDDCLSEMFVEIEWQERSFGVPLAQLRGVEVDDGTQQAIADWHYWVGMGYELCD
ncbi:MAG: calcium-binding protein [Gammaproteobacteria bacterium]